MNLFTSSSSLNVTDLGFYELLLLLRTACLDLIKDIISNAKATFRSANPIEKN